MMIIIIINGTYTQRHMPKPVYEKEDVTILWNQAVHTDREVTANRPDIINKNTKEKTWTLIDVAIPANRNVVQKEAKKTLKYKSLCTSNNWSHWDSNEKLKEKFGSCTRKTLNRFTTKTAILGTSHIKRKVLQCEA